MDIPNTKGLIYSRKKFWKQTNSKLKEDEGDRV